MNEMEVQKIRDWFHSPDICNITPQVLERVDALLASHDALATRVQAVEKERDEAENKNMNLRQVNGELREQLSAIKATVGDTEFSLRQQLAETQGMIERKDEALEINRQAHNIVRDQLAQAEQQVARLREASEPLAKLLDPIDGLPVEPLSCDKQQVREWNMAVKNFREALRKAGA